MNFHESDAQKLSNRCNFPIAYNPVDTDDNTSEFVTSSGQEQRQVSGKETGVPSREYCQCENEEKLLKTAEFKRNQERLEKEKKYSPRSPAVSTFECGAISDADQINKNDQICRLSDKNPDSFNQSRENSNFREKNLHNSNFTQKQLINSAENLKQASPTYQEIDKTNYKINKDTSHLNLNENPKNIHNKHQKKLMTNVWTNESNYEQSLSDEEKNFNKVKFGQEFLKKPYKKAVKTPTEQRSSSCDVIHLYYDSLENPKKKHSVKFAQFLEDPEMTPTYMREKTKDPMGLNEEKVKKDKQTKRGNQLPKYSNSFNQEKQFSAISENNQAEYVDALLPETPSNTKPTCIMNQYGQDYGHETQKNKKIKNKKEKKQKKIVEDAGAAPNKEKSSKNKRYQIENKNNKILKQNLDLEEQESIELVCQKKKIKNPSSIVKGLDKMALNKHIDILQKSNVENNEISKLDTAVTAKESMKREIESKDSEKFEEALILKTTEWKHSISLEKNLNLSINTNGYSQNSASGVKPKNAKTYKRETRKMKCNLREKHLVETSLNDKFNKAGIKNSIPNQIIEESIENKKTPSLTISDDHSNEVELKKLKKSHYKIKRDLPFVKPENFFSDVETNSIESFAENWMSNETVGKKCKYSKSYPDPFCEKIVKDGEFNNVKRFAKKHFGKTSAPNDESNFSQTDVEFVNAETLPGLIYANEFNFPAGDSEFPVSEDIENITQGSMCYKNFSADTFKSYQQLKQGPSSDPGSEQGTRFDSISKENSRNIKTHGTDFNEKLKKPHSEQKFSKKEINSSHLSSDCCRTTQHTKQNFHHKLKAIISEPSCIANFFTNKKVGKNDVQKNLPSLHNNIFDHEQYPYSHGYADESSRKVFLKSDTDFADVPCEPDSLNNPSYPCRPKSTKFITEEPNVKSSKMCVIIRDQDNNAEKLNEDLLSIIENLESSCSKFHILNNVEIENQNESYTSSLSNMDKKRVSLNLNTFNEKDTDNMIDATKHRYIKVGGITVRQPTRDKLELLFDLDRNKNKHHNSALLDELMLTIVNDEKRFQLTTDESNKLLKKLKPVYRRKIIFEAFKQNFFGVCFSAILLMLLMGMLFGFIFISIFTPDSNTNVTNVIIQTNNASPNLPIEGSIRFVETEGLNGEIEFFLQQPNIESKDWGQIIFSPKLKYIFETVGLNIDEVIVNELILENEDYKRELINEKFDSFTLIFTVKLSNKQSLVPLPSLENIILSVRRSLKLDKSLKIDPFDMSLTQGYEKVFAFNLIDFLAMDLPPKDFYDAVLPNKTISLVTCPPLVVDSSVIVFPLECALNSNHPVDRVCFFSCGKGSVLHGEEHAACLPSGVWSQNDAFCGKPCAPLLPIAKGRITPEICSNLNFSQTVPSRTQCVHYCDKNYRLIGVFQRECSQNGLWTYSPPVCKRECPILVPQKHVGIAPKKCFSHNSLEGDVCVFSCDKNRVLQGESATACDSDGRWTHDVPACRETCPAHQPVSHANVVPLECFTSTMFEGTSCYFTCRNGFHLHGSRIRTCKAGSKWSGETPQCKRVCPPVGKVFHGKVNPTSCTAHHQKVKTTCSFSCETGFTLRGASLLTCAEEGFWTAEKPFCLTTCPVLNPPPNSIMTCSDNTINSTCSLRCREGERLKGPGLAVCRDDGTWNAILGTCIGTCKKLQVPRYGSVMPKECGLTASVVGDSCTFQCNMLYGLGGSVRRTCLDGGIWSGTETTCDREEQYHFILEQKNIYVCLTAKDVESRKPEKRHFDDCTNRPLDLWSVHKKKMLKNSGNGFCIGFLSFQLMAKLVFLHCNESDERVIWEFPENTSVNYTIKNKNFYIWYGYSTASEVVAIDSQNSLSNWLLRDPETKSKTTFFGALNNGKCPTLQSESFGVWLPSKCSKTPSFPGATCSFVCNLSSKPNKKNTIVKCATGFWEGTIKPICIPSCSSYNLGLIKNGSISPRSECVKAAYVNQGTTCTIGCNSDYTLVGEMNIACLANSKWSSPSPTCEMYCSPIIPPSNGKLIPTKLCHSPFKKQKVGAICKIGCTDGYIIKGFEYSTCLENGNWNNYNFTCVRGCHPPLPPDKGHVDCNSNKKIYPEGTTCFYNCTDNRNLYPASKNKTVCLNIGTWNEYPPSCQYFCPKLANISNGKILPPECTNASSIPNEFKCSFSCNLGFTLLGELDIECLSTGVWSKNLPRCVPDTQFTLFRNDGFCLTAKKYLYRNIYKVLVSSAFTCNLIDKSHFWSINSFNQISNVKTRWCLSVSKKIEGGSVEMVDCDSSRRSQRWECLLNGDYSSIRLVDTNFTLQSKNDFVFISQYNTGRNTASWQTKNIQNSKVGTLCGMVYGNKGTCPLLQIYRGTNVFPPSCQSPVKIGSFCNITCEEGYEMDNGDTQKNISCEEPGVWSSLKIYCKKKKCPALPALSTNTSINNPQCTRSSFDAFFQLPCIYSCSPGFYLDRRNQATEELYCLGNGEWSEPVPKCLQFCEKLFQPLHGIIFPASVCTLENTIRQKQICSFSCQPHFFLDGSKHLQCSNGAWNASVPSCRSISGNLKCRGFFMNGNARVYPMSCYDRFVPQNMACRVNCKPGYKPIVVKDNQAVCQGNGLWSSPLPECRRVCPSFPAPPHGFFESIKCNSSVLTEGDSCQVICSPGYSLASSGKATCMKNGNWDKTFAICKHTPQFLLKIGQKCAYSTGVEGYVYYSTCSITDATQKWEWLGTTKIRNVNTQTCLVPEAMRSYASGKLTDCEHVQFNFQCPFSNDVEEGLVYNKKFRIAKAKADKPNKLFLVNPAEDDDLWKDFYITKLTAYNDTVNELLRPCFFRTSSNCPPLPKIKNGYIEERCSNGINVFVGTTCTYFCEIGYELVGLAKRKCQENGEWTTASLPECKKTCKPLKTPDFALVIPETCKLKNQLEGESCRFICNNSYELTGTERRFCRPDGLWSGSAVICHKPCPAVNFIKTSINPFVFPEDCLSGEQKMGMKCSLTCPYGYSLVGANVIVCMYNGSWSDNFPICRRTCPPLGTVLDGKITPLECIKFGRYDSNKCNFTCDDNFELRGVSSVTCNSDGFWSDSLPRCFRTCPTLDYPSNGLHNCTWNNTKPMLGEVCKFICSPGYAIEGSDFRTCLETSQWSGIQPICVRENQFVIIQSSPGYQESCLMVTYDYKLVLEQNNCEYESNFYVRWAWHETYLLRNSDSYLCLAGDLLLLGSFLTVKACNKSDNKQLWENSEPQKNWFFRLAAYKLYPLHSLLSINKVLLLNEESLDIVLSDSKFGTNKHTHWYAKSLTVARLPVAAARETDSCAKLEIGLSVDVTPKSCMIHRKFIGSICYFFCPESQKLNRPIVLTECLLGGIWSHATPQCVPACRSFSTRRFGIIKVSPASCSGEYFHPESFACTFFCPPNFYLKGNSVLTCQKNSQWNHMMPKCIPTCPAVNVLQHGKIIPENCTTSRVLEGTRCQYQCLHSEHILTGNHIRVCTKTGEWNQPESRCVKPCPIHPTPVGGYTLPSLCSSKPSLPGTICLFYCNQSFIQQGSAFRICLSNGFWAGETPTCEETCPKIKIPKNGILSPSSCSKTSSSPYSVCVLSCISGYTVSGVEVTECLNNGAWSHKLGECTIRCPKLKKPKNGIVEPRSCLGGDLYFGHQCSFACQQGFAIHGSEIRSCLSSGTWSGEKSRCQPSCSLLELRKNVNFIPPSCTEKFFVYGSTCEARCSPSTTFEDGSTRSILACEANGQWNSTNIDTCYPTCSEPKVKNGEAMCFDKEGQPTISYTTKTVCSVICNYRYIAESSTHSECIVTPQGPIWSPILAACIYEPDPMVIVNRVKYSTKCLGIQNRKVILVDWDKCAASFINTTWTWHAQSHIKNTNTGQCMGVASAKLNEFITTFPCNVSNVLQKWTCSSKDPYILQLFKTSFYIDTSIKERNAAILTDQTFAYSKFYAYNPLTLFGYGTVCSTRSMYGGGDVCVFPILDSSKAKVECLTDKDIEIGTSCIINCTKDDVEVVTCQENGLWQPDPISVCQKRCSPFDKPLGKNLMFEDIVCSILPVPFGFYCSVICQPGYISTKRITGITCSSGGKWSEFSENDLCIKSCSKIENVKNGKLVPTKCISGVCKLECNYGYKIEGPESRTCMNDGTWSGRNFSCSADIQFSIVSAVKYKLQTLCLEGKSDMIVIKTSCRRSKKSQRWRWNSQYTVENVIFRKCMAINTAQVRQFSTKIGFGRLMLNDGSADNIKFIKLIDDQENPVILKNCDAADFSQRWQCGSTAEEFFKLEGQELYLDSGAIFRPNLLISKKTKSRLTKWLGSYHTNYRSLCAFRTFGACLPLSEIPNGKVHGAACKSHFVAAGTRCKYSCTSNFLLKGRDETTCLISGKWSHKPPSCLGMNVCSIIKLSAHLQTFPHHCATTLSREGQICHFTCSKNAILNGKHSLLCLSNGTWDAATPTCSVICFPIHPPENGTIIPKICENTFLEPSFTCESKCDKDRILNGDAFQTCSADGTWIGKHSVCEKPCPVLSNFMLEATPAECLSSRVRSGTVCQTMCNYGFSINGSGSIACSDGLWSDLFPTCNSDYCQKILQNPDAIERVEYAGLNNGAIVLNSVLKITCNKGYRPKLTSYHVCFKYDTWSGGVPGCEMIPCSALNKLYRGKITPAECTENDQLVGAVCHFECASGYALYGPTSKECLLGGIWSSPELVVACHDTRPQPYPSTFIINIDIILASGSVTTKCLQISEDNTKLVLVTCDEENFHQRWKWFGSSQLKSIGSEKCLKVNSSISSNQEKNTISRFLYPGTCLFNDSFAIQCGSLSSPASKYQIWIGELLLGPYLAQQELKVVASNEKNNNKIIMVSWSATWVDYTRHQSYAMQPDVGSAPMPICSFMCGGNIISEIGNIASPNYPYNYPRNVRCDWKIILPDSEMELVLDLSMVTFQNTQFNYIRQGNCSQDYLEITHIKQSADSVLRLCSNSGQKRISTYFGGLRIVFFSDDVLLSKGLYGWAAHWWSRKFPQPLLMCGNSHDFPVTINDDPSMAFGAAWQVIVVHQARQFCNAAIYNKRFVITSAHCIEKFYGRINVAEKRQISVIYGFKNQIELIEMFQRNLENFAQKVWIHPDYSSDRPFNDIALVMTSSDIKFSEKLQPVCVTTSTQPQIFLWDQSVCWIVQWSRNAFILTRSTWDFTYFVPVTLLTNDKCAQFLKRRFENENLQNLLCARKVEDSERLIFEVNHRHLLYRYGDKEDSLLQCRWNKNWYLVGVSAFTYESDNGEFLYVFNAVSFFEAWISDVTDNAIYLLRKEFFNLF